MFTKVGRFDRARRIANICLTIVVGVFAAASVAGMIYWYYSTRRF